MIQTISGWTTSGVSLLILSVVSVDRLLALTLHLRYTTIVTVPRVHRTAVFLWIFSITGVMSRFFFKNWVIFPTVMLLFTLLVTALSTLKIFHIVRRHQRQITQQQQNVQNNTINVLKCRRSAVTILYIYGLILLFYLPLCATMLVDSFFGYTLAVKIAYDYAATAIFINSFLNPVVYCLRIGEIRRAVKTTLGKS